MNGNSKQLFSIHDSEKSNHMIVFALGMNYCLRDTVRSKNMYTDKYSLTREQSIFLAKKKWDENVFCGMKMENRNVTFPQTQAILNSVFLE